MERGILMRTDEPSSRPVGRLAGLRRVVILRALQLGDMLWAIPAIRAFRLAWPGAEIVLIGLPWARAFVERFEHLIDGFREFPGHPWLPERRPDLDEFPGFLAAIQAERFDLAIQLHGNGVVTNPMVGLFGARRTAGFHATGIPCPDPASFRTWPDRGREIHRLTALPAFLGLPEAGDHLEFPVNTSDRSALAVVAGPGLPAPGQYVCLHPGASVPERRWPVDRFAAVADAMAQRDLSIVLTGTANEAGLTRSLALATRAHCLDLAGKTNLGTLGALIEGARLLISNDTGVSHIAAGLGVPSVVISTGNNPERWAPIDRNRHRVLCQEWGVGADEAIGEAEALLHAFPRKPTALDQRRLS